MTPEQRFPELADFELEIELPRGWTTIRANEDERAAVILNDNSAISSMLCGGYRYVLSEGVKTRFRLTPKAWLKQPSQPDKP